MYKMCNEALYLKQFTFTDNKLERAFDERIKLKYKLTIIVYL